MEHLFHLKPLPLAWSLPSRTRDCADAHGSQTNPRTAATDHMYLRNVTTHKMKYV